MALVKVLAPGEVTITVLQGQGTALYTPLEQYGGDSGHTDIRSDIYALAATLYHLVTNQPPPDARDRFLHPDCLVNPRSINPAIHAHTENAILLGLIFHPDARPRQFMLFGMPCRVTFPPRLSVLQKNYFGTACSKHEITRSLPVVECNCVDGFWFSDQPGPLIGFLASNNHPRQTSIPINPNPPAKNVIKRIENATARRCPVNRMPCTGKPASL